MSKNAITTAKQFIFSDIYLQNVNILPSYLSSYNNIGKNWTNDYHKTYIIIYKYWMLTLHYLGWLRKAVGDY